MIGRKSSIAALLTLAAGAAYYFLTLPEEHGLPEGLASGNGRVEAVQVDVSTKFAGRVKDILVKEGDLVEVGQQVAHMDTSQLNAQLLRAQADIASAESQVAAAQAQVLVTKSQLELAKKELRRTDELLTRGGATPQLYDIEVTERDVARASVTGAEANLLSAQRNVDAAQAFAEEISTSIDDAVLTSTVFGRVLYRLAEPGEVLGAGGKIVTLVNYEDIYMEVFLPAHQAHLVNVGSDAQMKLDVWDFGIPATVGFVSPESQFTPKQVETSSERDKLMFRVKVRASQELIRHNIERVKAGLRGVAYVHLDGYPVPDWSSFLKAMPPEAVPEVSTVSDGQ